MSFKRPIKSPRDPLNRAFSLPRLPREHYQADAVVFWTLTMFDKAKGWLTPAFHQRFRELMFHVAARGGLICPIYCLMPDHIHLIWMGLRLDSDQVNGMPFLRIYLEPELSPAKFQPQPQDEVLREEQRKRNAFAKVCF
jgi:hypothetical protein